ncbi:MAG: hypothetical protein RLY31_1920 [Bacteroidota bacterium]|jgi:AAA family ATP:ADP antiporter
MTMRTELLRRFRIALSGTVPALFRRAFDIREGELGRAFHMQAVIFLLISTLLIVKPTVNALFLARFGVEQLPMAFLLVAVAAAVVSAGYTRMLARYSLYAILRGTIYGSMLSLLVFGSLLLWGIQESVVLYLFYCWVAIFALLSTSQFWLLANLVFNVREAKRLFGFIGAGAIAGGIAGGYLTSVLATAFRVEWLLFVGVVLLALCLPFLGRIWERGILPGQAREQVRWRTGRFSADEHPLLLIRRSRHLSYVAGIVTLGVMVAKLVDYQFGGVAAAAIEDPGELTAFFGFWFSTFNVVSLLFQLFLTRWVVGLVGVGGALFFLPAFIAAAAGLLLVFPGWLPAAILLKMSDGSLKQSLNKAAMELVVLPVPTDLKHRTKTFIDVFVDSMATGLSGLILIFLVKGLDLPGAAVSALMILLIGAWVFLIVQVRKEYLRAFRLRLRKIQQDPMLRKGRPDLRDREVAASLLQVLQDGSERQRLFVLDSLRELPLKAFLPTVCHLLGHPSARIRAAALDALYHFEGVSCAPEIPSLVHDEDTAVRLAAFRFLLAHGPEPAARSAFRHLFASDDLPFRAALLAILAAETGGNAYRQQTYELKEHLVQVLGLGDAPPAARGRLLEAIGRAAIPDLYEQLFPYFSDQDPQVVKAAIRAAGQTEHPMFIRQLLRFLPLPAFRRDAVRALARYGRQLPPLLRELRFEWTGSRPDLVRRFPTVLREIPTPSSVQLLLELLDMDDPVIRENALHALNALRNRHPHLKPDHREVVRRILHEARQYQDMLPVLYQSIYQRLVHPPERLSASERAVLEARMGLTRLLEQRLDRSLERIFRLLGLKYPSEDIMAAYADFRSPKEEIRVNALEFLDNLLEPNLKKVLVPIMESALINGVPEPGGPTGLLRKIPTEYDCFKLILRGRDNRLKLAALYLIRQLADRKFMPLLLERVENDQDRIRDYAAGVLADLQAHPDT